MQQVIISIYKSEHTTPLLNKSVRIPGGGVTAEQRMKSSKMVGGSEAGGVIYTVGRKA